MPTAHQPDRTATAITMTATGLQVAGFPTMGAMTDVTQGARQAMPLAA